MMTYDNYFMNSVIFDIHYAIFQNSVELTVKVGNESHFLPFPFMVYFESHIFSILECEQYVIQRHFLPAAYIWSSFTDWSFLIFRNIFL